MTDEWAARRWHASGLGGGRWAPAASTAVGQFGAMQAQEFEVTLWSLAQRTGQTREQILAEFQAGDFVRTHAIRQTWHFVRRTDLGRVQAATADRVQLANAGMYRSLGLDPESLRAWAKWLRSFLADGPKDRVEIRTSLAADGRPMENLTLIVALMWAELELIIANGPMRGRAQTYALIDVAKPERQESINWLLRTFLTSHGPSTTADIAAWCSLRRTDIRTALDAIGAQSAQGPHGTEYWLGPSGLTPSRPGTALLNGYDEYVSGLAAVNKRRLDPDRLASARSGTPVHVLMCGGFLAGYWRRIVKGPTTVLQVNSRRVLDEADRAGLTAQTQAFAAFIGGSIELREEP